MIKRILVALDSSADGSSALNTACNIASQSKADLCCLIVEDQRRFLQFSLPLAMAETFTGEVLTAAPLEPEAFMAVEEQVSAETEVLREAASSLGEKYGVPVQTDASRGIPWELIAAASRGADLVVLSNPYRFEEDGHAAAALEPIVRRITRPTLIVPKEVKSSSLFVVAYDGSPAADRALRAAAELASQTGLQEIHLVTVSAEEDNAADLHRPILPYLQAYDLKVVPVVRQGRPHEVITEYAAEAETTILAMGAFGSNQLSEALFGSTTLSVIEKAKAIVLLST